jgi:hypothetical protein
MIKNSASSFRFSTKADKVTSMYERQPSNAIQPQATITVKAMPPLNLKLLAEHSSDYTYPVGNIDDFTTVPHELCFTFVNSENNNPLHDFVFAFPSLNGLSLLGMHYTKLAKRLRLAGVSKAGFAPLSSDEIVGSGFALVYYGSTSILNNLIRPAFIIDPLCWNIYPIEEASKFTYHSRGVMQGQKSKLAPYLEPFDFKRVRYNEKILLSHALANGFHFKDLIESGSSNGLPMNMDGQAPSTTQIASGHFTRFCMVVAQAAIRTLLYRGILKPIKDGGVKYDVPNSNVPEVTFRAFKKPEIIYSPSMAGYGNSLQETAPFAEVMETVSVGEALEQTELDYAEMLGLTSHVTIRGTTHPRITKALTIQKEILSEMFFEDLHLGKFSFATETSTGQALTESINDFLTYHPCYEDILKSASRTTQRVVPTQPDSMKTHYVQNRRNTSYNLHNTAVFLNQETVGATIGTAIGESHERNRNLDIATNVTNYVF